MMMKKPKASPARVSAKLKAKIALVAELSYSDEARMFQLMRGYYEGVSREQFLADLAKKSQVILLLDARDGQIQGFSTLLCLQVTCGDKTLRGIFSGDTVVEKSYWGQRVLGKAFLRFLFKEKLRRPFAPLYWLLISKGYKTYLMMANNFSEYYPRFDAPTAPGKRAIMDAFYSTLYREAYDAESGVIKPAVGAYKLKTGVAPISGTLIKTNPKVAFFQQANPDWQQGVELACLARMTLWMPCYYALKVFAVDRVLKPISRVVFPLLKARKNE
jgi:hypothetical protein